MKEKNNRIKGRRGLSEGNVRSNVFYTLLALVFYFSFVFLGFYNGLSKSDMFFGLLSLSMFSIPFWFMHWSMLQSQEFIRQTSLLDILKFAIQSPLILISWLGLIFYSLYCFLW